MSSWSVVRWHEAEGNGMNSANAITQTEEVAEMTARPTPKAIAPA